MEGLSFIVAGMSDATEPVFDTALVSRIAKMRYFSGGNRHYDLVKNLLPEGHIWIPVTVPLPTVYEQYSQINESILVFASGDPLFFGFGATLLRQFPHTSIEIHPYYNSIQMLAQKAAVPYHNICNVSLTGRPWHKFDVALICQEQLIGILTDKKKTPRVIASYMLQFGYTNYEVIVGEYLGGERERIIRCSVEQCAGTDFADLNCMLLAQKGQRVKMFGIPESVFDGLPGRPNMITKAPYRLVSLSKLDLCNAKTLWDIGFCTGSVSIEAKLQFPDLHVIAFEKRPESAQLMQANMERFGVPGIEYHIGDFFSQDLAKFQAPDSVFIGGHGGRLYHLLSSVVERLVRGGTIVINAVTDDSRQLFIDSCNELGLALVDELHISLNGHNPLSILTAKKK